MIEVRGTGLESAQRRLTQLKAKLDGGMEAVHPETISAIDEIVRAHDAAVFIRKARTEWPRVSLPTALFSRSSVTISPVKTIQAAMSAAAGDLLPLIDTGRLFNSIAQNNADHVVVVAGQSTLIIGTSVEYAAKHWSGDWQLFVFGPAEEDRLGTRVVKPLDGKDRERDYYRLRSWAREQYPVKAWVPARSWYEPLTPEETSRIGELIGNDEMNLL